MRFFRALPLILILPLALSLSACASLYGKKFQNVSISSEPLEAAVYVDSKFVGRTPVVIVLPITRSSADVKRRKSLLDENRITQEEFDNYSNLLHRITVTKEGVGTSQFQIQPKAYNPDGVNYGLCVFDAVYSPILLFTPLAINFSTGRCHGFDKHYDVDLTPRPVNSRGVASGAYGIGLSS